MLLRTQGPLALALAFVACGRPGHAVEPSSNIDRDGDTACGHPHLAVAYNLQTIDAACVRRICTEATRSWPDGSPVLLPDREQGDTEHEAFCQEWLGRSAAAMQAAWSRDIFSGKGSPPRLVATDAEAKRLVAAHLEAIGYIRSDSVDETVKVIRP